MYTYQYNQLMEKKIKKIIMTALALIIVAASTEAMAQPKAVLGLGGGVITSGSVPGGGINLTMNRAESPLAFGITGEYYTKSGATNVPIGVVGMYQASNESGKATFFLGAGPGLIYLKTSVTVPILGTISASTTKAMATGLAGVRLSLNEKIGVFVKGQFYRAITSGAKNNISIGGGLAINLGS